MKKKENIKIDALLQSRPQQDAAADFEERMLAKIQEVKVEAKEQAYFSNFINYCRHFFEMWKLISIVLSIILVIILSPLQIPQAGVLTSKGSEVIFADRSSIIVTNDSPIPIEIAFKEDFLGQKSIRHINGTANYNFLDNKTFVVETNQGILRSSKAVFRLNISPTHRVNIKGENMNYKELIAGGLFGAGLSMMSIHVFSGELSVATKNNELCVIGANEIYENGQKVQRREKASSERLRYKKLKNEFNNQKIRLEELLNGMGSQSELLEKNVSLEKRLARAEKELAIELEDRENKDGVAFDFPENLEEKYLADELKLNMSKMMQKVGLNGDVKAIDCSEFPCLLHVETQTKGGDFKKVSALYNELNSKLDQIYDPEKNTALSTLYGDQRTDLSDGEIYNGVMTFTVFAKDSIEKDRNKELHKRINFRLREYREASK